ncbi:MAG: hypothetical protein ABI556_16045 [Gemmatimonadales bacterium]
MNGAKGSAPVSPRDDWFDRLARRAASGVSRRDAVGMLAGTTVMAFFGASVKPSRLVAAEPKRGDDPGCSGTRSAYREGCSKVPKLNYTPAINGCGPQKGTNLVPQAPLYLADFTQPCNGHDRGYGTCNRPKDVTDSKFLEDMKAVCEGSGAPISGFVNALLMLQCVRNAEIFYLAVSELGDDPYKEGQKEGCDCCDDCPGGALKCKGECCRAGNWICGKSGKCCEDCAPGWIKCESAEESRCGYGCCRPGHPVCCPTKRPGIPTCCNKCNGAGGCG